MLNLFKPKPTKKMRKQLSKLQEQSMNAQRKGDIRLSSEFAAQADVLWKQIQELESKSA